MGSKVVIRVNGGDLQVFFETSGRLQKKIIQYTYGRVDCALALGESLRSQFAGLVSDSRVKVVLNCYHEDVALKQKSRRQRRTGEAIRIVFLSNVLPSKGLFDALGWCRKGAGVGR